MSIVLLLFLLTCISQISAMHLHCFYNKSQFPFLTVSLCLHSAPSPVSMITYLKTAMVGEISVKELKTLY